MYKVTKNIKDTERIGGVKDKLLFSYCIYNCMLQITRLKICDSRRLSMVMEDLDYTNTHSSARIQLSS